MEIRFIERRRIGYAVSTILIGLGILSLIVKGGPNLGIDFSGGTLLHLKFEHKITVDDLEEMRRIISAQGLKAGIQRLGLEKKEVIIKVKRADGTESSRVIRDALKKRYPDFVSSESFVGPSIGEDLKRLALLAICLALLGILAYITVRFEFKFALGAIAALVHDVLIVVGGFSLLDKEFNIPVVAAILAVIGYSLNDTIVVFDRIRENVKLCRRERYPRILNISINQCLSRTLVTSLTTLFAVVVLFVFGSIPVRDFSLALIIGVVVGTYSSIFVAAPVLLEWQNIRGLRGGR